MSKSSNNSKKSKILDLDQISAEESMWQMYRLSYAFPASKFNLGVFLFAFIALLLFLFAGRRDISFITTATRAIVSFGVSLAPSILGFLVAGFTIFVTVTKAELFEHMAVRRYEQTEHSYLKYNMSAFMLAFAHYLAYLFVCAAFVIFAQPLGPVIFAARFVARLLDPACSCDSYYTGAAIFLAFFGAWTLYLLMLLKSFIYNVYHVLTTSIRWGLEVKRARNA